MSRCPPASQLDAFAAGVVADAGVARHIAACGRCSAAIQEYRDNLALLASFGPDLAGAFQAAIGEPWQRLRSSAPAFDVPGYELAEEVARGGQGVVYKARHIHTKRWVAVKTLLAGSFATALQQRRFEREIEIAAKLRHPAIVSIFDSGITSDGRRFVTMEWVSGIALDEFVENRSFLSEAGPARTRQLVCLLRRVAEGVAYAHANGVLHRDLKPSNILVDDQGLPRILDFGLARTAEQSAATITHEFAATPAYAAPEQFDSRLGPADTRTDVYALGLMLYRALTSEHPYPCHGGFAAMARHVVSTPPVPPTRFVPRLPVDVETIVLKALAKEPQRRYASAVELMNDIDDYLNGRPISARRDSTAYVLKHLALRHRVPAAAAGLALFTVIGATVGLAVLAANLNRSRQSAELALSESNVQRARMIGDKGDVDRAETILWHEAFKSGMDVNSPGLGYSGTTGVIRSAWSLAELYSRVPRINRFRVERRSAGLSFDAENEEFRLVQSDGRRKFLDLNGRILRETPPLFPGDPNGTVFFDRTGTYAATLGGSLLRLWNLQSGQPILEVEGVWTWGRDEICISPDGSFLASTGGNQGHGRLSFLRVSPLEVLAQFDDDQAAAVVFASTARGTLLLTGTRLHAPPTVVVRSVPEMAEIARSLLPASARPNGIVLPRISSDARWLVVGSGGALLVNDLQNGTQAERVYVSNVSAIEIDHSASLLGVGHEDGTVRVLGLPGLVELASFANGYRVSGLGLTKSPGRILVLDVLRRISTYELGDRPWFTRVGTLTEAGNSLVALTDGRLIWGGLEGLYSRDADPPHRVVRSSQSASRINAVAVSVDETLVASGGHDGILRLWTKSGQLLREIAPEGQPKDTPVSEIWSLAFSRDGGSVACGDRRGDVTVYSTEGKVVAVFKSPGGRVPQLAFSPDGRSLAACHVLGGNTVVWDYPSGQQRLVLEGVQGTRALEYSPDGELLVIGSDDRSLRVWHARTGKLLRVIDGLPWGPFDLLFHPSGRVLFACGRGGEVVVVDVQEGNQLASLSLHTHPIYSLALRGESELISVGKDNWLGITDLDRLLGYVALNEPYWKSELGHDSPADPKRDPAGVARERR